MMLVGFLGCYGAIQESQCLLGTVSNSLIYFNTPPQHHTASATRYTVFISNSSFCNMKWIKVK